MEIIAALEPQRRGLYAGAVGYLDFAGNLDCCIAIRTAGPGRRPAPRSRPAPGSSPTRTRPTEYDETKNEGARRLRAVRAPRATARARSMQRWFW